MNTALRIYTDIKEAAFAYLNITEDSALVPAEIYVLLVPFYLGTGYEYELMT